MNLPELNKEKTKSSENTTFSVEEYFWISVEEYSHFWAIDYLNFWKPSEVYLKLPTFSDAWNDLLSFSWSKHPFGSTPSGNCEFLFWAEGKSVYCYPSGF